MPKGKVIVSVINDLVTDNRVNRSCVTLVEAGYEVLMVGRKLRNSPPLPSDRPYQMHRMKLLFTTGPLFYAEYNMRLFLLLLFCKQDFLLSNDLDTLLANYLISRLKGKPVVYDSHEFFTGVPELQHNAFARKFWIRIERNIVPRLKWCITVNRSIADMYTKMYNVPFVVIRNVPIPLPEIQPKTRHELGMPEDKTVLLLQGSGINIHRGAEELVEAMTLLPEQFHLYIIGGGDVVKKLEELVNRFNLRERITFLPRQPYAAMMQYTRNADIGLSLDKDNNLNYKFSLPNKIFDYMQAGIPVIASDLPELRRIMDDYKIGRFIREVTPQTIAEMVLEMYGQPEALQAMRTECARAAQVFNWTEERKTQEELFRKAFAK